MFAVVMGLVLPSVVVLSSYPVMQEALSPGNHNHIPRIKQIICNIANVSFSNVRILIPLISPFLYNWRLNVTYPYIKSSSILSELSGLEERTRNTSGLGYRDEKPDDSSVPRQLTDSEHGKEQPDWLVKELLKQSRRRHSVTLGDNEKITRQQYHLINSTYNLKVKI